MPIAARGLAEGVGEGLRSRGWHPRSGGAPRQSYPADFEKFRKFELQLKDELPHDVIHYETPDPDYPWRLDAYRCYLLACRLKALAVGSLRPATPAELYWAEAHGQIA